MLGRLPISLLSALAWSSLSDALVPADPTITAPAELSKRQNNAAYIGWLSTKGTWSSVTCDAGATWYQEEKYAQCCPTTVAACVFPTACLSGTLIYPPASGGSTVRSLACTSAYDEPAFTMCNSVFIFENFQDSKPKTNINCGNSLSNWSYYRNIPASATEAAPSSTPSPSASVTDSNPQPISSTPAAPAQKKKKKKSKGWIAGAVIGPLLGLAIGLIALFLIRRRKKSQQPQPGAAVAGGAPPVQESSEAKPVFAQQGAYAPTTPGYNPHDPYNQQQQQAYGQSPDPQYNTPYNAPGSPPPPQNAYPSDHKYGYNQESTPGFVAELGGGGERAPAPQAAELGDGSVSAPVASGSHAAELSSEPVPKTK